MKKVTGMLGRYYPFFLSNTNLGDAHYLYQLYSPKVDEKTLTPYVSLTKVSERTYDKQTQPEGSDLDLIRVCTGKKQITPGDAAEYIDIAVKHAWGKMHYDEGTDNFPYVEMNENNQFNQRTLVVTLKDCLRWKNYRFYPGRLVDVLWTKDEFTLFEICEDDTTLFLKPLNVLYKNTDTGMSNPKEYNFADNGFVSEHIDKTKPTKASDLNKYIRSLEWGSFIKRSIF